MIKSILNAFKCSLIKSHICDYDANNKQLFHLTLLYKNCIKVYINDVLVPKKNIYLASVYKDNQTIKVKLVGLFNSQTHFLEIRTQSIDVSFHLFEKRNVLRPIEAINRLSHKKISLTSLIKQKQLKVNEEMKRSVEVDLSKTIKLDLEIINQNYNLTNLTNNYEQAHISNT
jgi:hypothetical protein